MIAMTIDNEKTLILLRGLPGAGKTSMCDILGTVPGLSHFEADLFFINKSTGEYEFDANNLFSAHAFCEFHTARALSYGIPRVSVANTFTTEKELEYYTYLAKEHNYRLVSLVVENRHDGKCLHEVPERTLASMQGRFSLKLRG